MEKRKIIMKKLLQLLSIISMFVSVYEVVCGTTDKAILFLVWSFYLKDSSKTSE